MDINSIHPLISIKIYCLEQKTRLLAGGKGLIEPEIPPEPELDDYVEVTFEDEPREPQIAHEDTKLLPDVEPKKSKKSIKEKLEQEQISIEDALETATSNQEIEQNVARECASADAVEPTPPGEEETHNSPSKLTLKQRIQNFLQAWRDWRIEKFKREYEFERTKRSILEQCAIYDDVIAYVDAQITEQRTLSQNNPFGQNGINGEVL